MKFNIQDMTKLLGGSEVYFTVEQINFICIKLIDPKSYSLYLQSVMATDMKIIKLTR